MSCGKRCAVVSLCGIMGRWMLTCESDVKVAPLGSWMSIARDVEVGEMNSGGTFCLLKKCPVAPVSAIVSIRLEGGLICY